MFSTLLLAINVTVLTYVLIESVLTINQMTRHTPHSLRVVYVALAVGSFYSLLHGQLIHIPAVMSNIALAYFVHRSKLPKCDITGVHKALNI